LSDNNQYLKLELEFCWKYKAPN